MKVINSTNGSEIYSRRQLIRFVDLISVAKEKNDGKININTFRNEDRKMKGKKATIERKKKREESQYKRNGD